VIAMGGILLSYASALLCGYESSGDFGALLVVGIVSSLAMVAVSLIIASFLNTVFDVLTIGVIPFFVIMFFSGGMIPMPKVNLITFGGRGYGLSDLIPLSHTTGAFNKILNYNAGFGDVLYEIIMILILTVIYLFLGIVLYKYRRLSKA
jgi:ABC-2 type transport system permease protein